MPHPTIPIPADARVGDIIWFRDGQRKAITDFPPEGAICVFGLGPGWVRRNGEARAGNIPDWECIGFQYADNRKPPIGAAKPAKPKPDADAEWLRKLIREGQTMDSDTMHRRLRKIAKRLEHSK